MSWNTTTVEAEANWTVEEVAPSSTITEAVVETSSTWNVSNIETSSTWSVSNPMIGLDVDKWAVLEAVPLYFTEKRLWNELKVAWS